MANTVAHFGDRRVDRSCRFLHDCLVRHGPRGISVRRLGGDRAGEVRIGRFLRNGKVTVEKIVEQASSGTAERVEGLDILAIQDTTSFRDDGLQASERCLAGAARVTAVCDREGDIYEMFADQPEGVEVLIRAAQDRAVSEGTGKLFSSLADRPEKEHMIDLPARPGQRKRKARIALRFGIRGTGPWRPASQPVFLVEAREIDPPPGVTPAHWRLLTSHRVESFEQAR